MKIIFHIDVNSAYLSWTAAKRLVEGETLDIRSIPSVVGGEIDSRHGIVLAKSIPAKKYNIQTGEPLFSAISKCNSLKIYPPDYGLFMKCSNSMVNLLEEYSPIIQRYSIDECFVDCSHFKDNYIEVAKEISKRIEKELGFTVNIGISTNKLLAKMASDLEKPNKIHTLFKDEIKDKMWPLKVSELFMVGRATQKKLQKLNIKTIGELANYDLETLKAILNSHGELIYNYANGIDNSQIKRENYIGIKGIGNSTTIAYDMENEDEIYKVILSLVENSAMRLRRSGKLCAVVVISLKNASFISYSHQRKLIDYTDSTEKIYKELKVAFREVWSGEKIRQIGVRLTSLCDNEFYQSSMFDSKNIEKQRAIDKTIDRLREKYGNNIIVRSNFLHSGFDPVTGGVGEDGYLFMSSIL